ncbi:MAG TPA: universal stress protein [Gaiellaceae bacterium]
MRSRPARHGACARGRRCDHPRLCPAFASPCSRGPVLPAYVECRVRPSAGVVEEAAAGVVAAGVDVETEILEGNPADSIAKLARSRAVDLIIVGSRGRGGIAGGLLGSVSEGVVHRADRPVLVVKPRSKTARRAA